MKIIIALSCFMLSSSISFTQYRNVVGIYSFEHGMAIDGSGFGEDGIVYGHPKSVKGVIGRALYFDGGSHAIVFRGRVNRYLRSTRDFTISFFFKSDDASNKPRSLMGKRHKCKGFNMFDIRVGRNISVEVYEKERPKINANVYTPVEDLEWHHYVFVKKDNTTLLYKDGELVAKNQSKYIIGIADLAPFGINDSPCIGIDGTRNMKGSIDELMIYKNDLDSDEIRKLYFYYKKQWDEQRGHREEPEQIAGQLDPRMNKIFGTYYDEGNQLTLDSSSFSLIINQPEAYPNYDRAILVGKYKIEAGQLVLSPAKILLKQTGDSGTEQNEQQAEYRGDPIIGDIYNSITIDLSALESRLKFRKSE